MDHKYLSDVYCTHLNMKNKFVSNYDDNNLHQNPDVVQDKEMNALSNPALTSVKKSPSPKSPKGQNASHQ